MQLKGENMDTDASAEQSSAEAKRAKTKIRKPYPGRAKLKELKAQGLSNVRIGHLYGKSSVTIHRWMVRAGLEEAKPSDVPDQERWARLVKQEEEKKKSAALALVDAQTLESAEAPTFDSQSPSHKDGFRALSVNQRRAVLLLQESPDASNEQLADALGTVAASTIQTWRGLEHFQQALKEMLVPAFRTEAMLLVMHDLRRIVRAGDE